MQGSTLQFETHSQSHRTSPLLQLLNYWKHPGLPKTMQKRLYGHNNSRKTMNSNKLPIRPQKLRERERRKRSRRRNVKNRKNGIRKNQNSTPSPPTNLLPVTSLIAHLASPCRNYKTENTSNYLTSPQKVAKKLPTTITQSRRRPSHYPK